MKHILENIYPNYRPTLWDRLMTSTSLSSSELRERKTLQEVMTITNPVLLGMLLIACGGGGGGGSTPAAAPLALQITPFEGNPIGTDPINSDGVGLLNENADGSITTVDIGTLTDNKNANGEAYYALPETAPTGTNNDEFDIMGDTGAQVLQFRGKYAGDYEASTRPKYTLKIERYDSKAHYDSVKAGEADAKPPQILDYILNLKNLEQGLAITAADDAPFVHKDGEGFLNEEVDGSTTPILLLTLGDGSGTYRLTNHTDRFEVTGNQLFYKGTALDYENPNDPKSFTLNIAHTNAGVTQTFEYTINSQDQIEVLGITPPGDDAPIFSDGAELLPENANGSTNRIEIGTIIDNIVTTLPVSYRLADPENTDFQIADGKLYYIGADSGDFEAGDKLMVDIIRTLDGNAETEQTLQRVINLKNLNDNPPDLTGYLPAAEGQTEPTEIGNIAAGLVGDDRLLMVFKVDDAENHQVTIDFSLDAGSVLLLTIVPKYVNDDPTNKLTGFEIATGSALSYTNIIAILEGKLPSQNQTSSENFAIWQEYFDSVTFVGETVAASPNTTGAFYTNDATLTGKQGISVAAGTTGTIANFASLDPDGNLNDFEYSVSDETNFQINNDGELRFKAAPVYDAVTAANNTREVTITVSDGTFSGTYTMQVVVVPSAAESVSNAGESAAEAVPDTDKNALNKEPQKWEPSPFDNIFDDDDPFGPIGGGGGDGVL